MSTTHTQIRANVQRPDMPQHANAPTHQFVLRPRNHFKRFHYFLVRLSRGPSTLTPSHRPGSPITKAGEFHPTCLAPCVRSSIFFTSMHLCTRAVMCNGCLLCWCHDTPAHF